jgi:hypothetical protein
MRNDDDLAAGQAGAHADHGLDLTRTLARDLERRAAGAVGGAERVGHAVRERRVVRRPGRAVGIRAPQLGQRVAQRGAAAERAVAAERVGRQRGGQRRGAVGERERGHEQRDERREEGSPIDPNVEHYVRGYWSFSTLTILGSRAP